MIDLHVDMAPDEGKNKIRTQKYKNVTEWFYTEEGEMIVIEQAGAMTVLHWDRIDRIKEYKKEIMTVVK